jgi:hypothetical protein
MGANLSRLEESMSNVLDVVPEHFRVVVENVLSKRDPELLAALQSQDKPTEGQQLGVIDALADEFSEHLGPGQEPTEQGKLVDNALGAFLTAWPNEKLAD